MPESRLNDLQTSSMLLWSVHEMITFSKLFFFKGIVCSSFTSKDRVEVFLEAGLPPRWSIAAGSVLLKQHGGEWKKVLTEIKAPEPTLPPCFVRIQGLSAAPCGYFHLGMKCEGGIKAKVKGGDSPVNPHAAGAERLRGIDVCHGDAGCEKWRFHEPDEWRHSRPFHRIRLAKAAEKNVQWRRERKLFFLL